MDRFVIIIMTFVRSASELRARLAVQTCKEARKLGCPVIVVDGGSSREFCEELADNGAKVERQLEQGFGSAFRQSLWLVPEGYSVFRMEPEKHDLVKHVPEIMKPVCEGRVHMVNPIRNSLDSYSPEQQCSERMVNLAFRYVCGLDVDVCFGPLGLSPEAFPYFLNYDGKYGDIWDALHVPRLRVIAAGLQIENVRVNYIHPPEQTQEETGQERFFKKRVEQIQKLAAAFWGEGRALGLVK